MTVRIGISGWRYAGWRGVFYPPGLAQRDELVYAARVFPSIEINGTFYCLQRPECFEQWYRATPPGFVFAVKGGRYITHMLKLNNAEAALANFFAQGLFNLREKLGPILWQLPAQLRFDAARLEAFLRLLPRDTAEALALARRRDHRVHGRSRLAIDAPRRLRHALEIRHESFLVPQFVQLLRRYDVALVVADSAGIFPQREDITADFVYVRLHGDTELYASGYADAVLEHWSRRIAAWRDGVEPPHARLIAPALPPPPRPRDVYCYFDNDAKVKAPFDAAALAAKLGLALGGIPGEALAASSRTPAPAAVNEARTAPIPRARRRGTPRAARTSPQ